MLNSTPIGSIVSLSPVDVGNFHIAPPDIRETQGNQCQQQNQVGQKSRTMLIHRNLVFYYVKLQKHLINMETKILD